jgi:hypothetical protein
LRRWVEAGSSRRAANRPGHPVREARGGSGRIPAMTDFRARGTIMGPAGLTAVFGMGTGVTPPVSSPERPPAGGQATPGTGTKSVGRSRRPGQRHGVAVAFLRSTSGTLTAAGSSPEAFCSGVSEGVDGPRRDPGRRRLIQGRGGRIGVVKLSAVGTGPLRRSPAVHSQPIDLVVFQEPSQRLLPETSSWRGLRA